MRITGVETVMSPAHPSILWVLIHTDSDVVGLGETVGQPRAVAAIVHDMFAGLLVNCDPLQIEAAWQRCYRAINYYGIGGAEMRALSAVDMALWDILGKVSGQPIHALLGGRSRDAVPIYNTCGDWGSMRDRDRFLREPVALARELVDKGIRIMKVWPFDEFATARGGQYIDARDVRQGMAGIAAVRDALGDDVDIAVEGHGLWNLPMAIRIARALEPLRPLWIEDLVWPENSEVLVRLSDATSIPVIASERLLGRASFRQIIERPAAQIVMPDLAWTGGVSEGVKVAAMAATYLLPIAPHNCGGPVSHAVTLQFCAHIPNLLAMETVRAFYVGFFADLVTDPPLPEHGAIPVPMRPGHGVSLRPDLLADPSTVRQRTDQPNRDATGLAAGDPWTTAKF